MAAERAVTWYPGPLKKLADQDSRSDGRHKNTQAPLGEAPARKISFLEIASVAILYTKSPPDGGVSTYSARPVGIWYTTMRRRLEDPSVLASRSTATCCDPVAIHHTLWIFVNVDLYFVATRRRRFEARSGKADRKS